MPDHDPRLRVAFYGDDFTGSVDALLQFTRAGWQGRLFVRMPEEPALRAAAEQAEVVGVAGIARSLAADDLEDEIRPILQRLADLNPVLVQYKACSTADSSAAIGSLGRVIEIGRDVFGDDHPVPALFAQPDFGRYTAFGHHFAAEDQTVYRLDRQPTMSEHPVTPMRESDLARHLSAQTELPVGGLHLDTYTDPDAVAGALRAAPAAATVLDAVDDGHLRLLGHAITDLYAGQPLFAIGSGGLSTALGTALGSPSPKPVDAARDRSRPPLRGDAGRGVLAVSGSRSPRTARQIAYATEHGWLRLHPDWTAEDPAETIGAALRDALGEGRNVLVSAEDAPARMRDQIPNVLARVVGSTLRAGRTRRVIVCGGDTSSRILRRLGAGSLTIRANPVQNVVICAVAADADWLDGTEFLLKGGQVGPDDLFQLARAGLSPERAPRGCP